MQYLTELHSCRSEERFAVTLGKFDGLHCGHQKLIDRVRKYASENHVKSMVCAFDMGRDALLTEQERRERLEGQADCLIVVPFTREIREMGAEDFIREILIGKFHAACVVVGCDYRFGYQRRGDVELLAKYADIFGYRLDVLGKEKYNGREISSSYIREALARGEMETVGRLLGYPYRIKGRVEHGRRLGRELGFPTINLAPEEGKVTPRFGVYASRILLDGRWYQGIANIGIKPTVAQMPRVLTEAFLFDYEGDAYGKEVSVEFCEFERPEIKFHSISELKEQLEKDICFGRDYFTQRAGQKSSV